MQGPELRHFLLPLVLERVRQGMEVGNLAKLFAAISFMPGDREDYVAQEIMTNLKRAFLNMPPEGADAHKFMETNSATLASSRSHADALLTLQRHFPNLPVEDQNDLRGSLERGQQQLENKLTALIASSLASFPTAPGSVDAAMVGIERAKQAYSALLHLIDHPLKNDPAGAMESLLRSRTEPQFHTLLETFYLCPNPKREAAARGLRAEAMMRALPHVAQVNKKTQQDLDLNRIWDVVKRPDPNRQDRISEVFGPGLDAVAKECKALWASIPDKTLACLSILSTSEEIATKTKLSDKELDQYARQLDNMMREHEIGGEYLGFVSLLPDVQKLKTLRPEARPTAFRILTEAACKEAQARIADQVHTQREVLAAQAALRESQHQKRAARKAGS